MTPLKMFNANEFESKTFFSSFPEFCCLERYFVDEKKVLLFALVRAEKLSCRKLAKI